MSPRIGRDPSVLGRIRGKPRDDDPALEELRRRTAARLAAIVGLSAETEPEDDLGPADEPGPDAGAMAVALADEAHEEIPLASDDVQPAAETPAEAAPAAAVIEIPPQAPPARLPLALPQNAVAVMAEPVVSAARVAMEASRMEIAREDAVPAAVASRTPDLAAEPEPPRPAAPAARQTAGAPVPSEPPRPAPVRPVPPPAAESAPTAARPPTGASRAAPRQAARPAAAPATTGAPKPAPRPAPKPTGKRRRAISTLLPAACPTCGALLETIPTSARRCPDCRARIVVKRVEGRIVLLSESVVPLFDAERRRLADAERLKRAGGRWLQMAALAGAAPEVLEKRARALAARPTSEAVSAARTLYATTVERACRAARRAKDWKTVSDLRLRQARAYHRTLGTQLPVDASVVALHREAMEAMLRRIAEVSREAELVGGTCCEACSAQSGREVRITAELKAPSLPHADCPAGLCGCRWDVPSRHREAITRLARRRAR